VKLKLIFVGLTIGLVQITPSDAQSISPAGHYTYNRRGQLGEMRVQRSERSGVSLSLRPGHRGARLRPQIVGCSP